MTTPLTTALTQPTESSNQLLVRCNAMGRTYGHGANAVVAVHDVTCEVRLGARIAITGPSGSGKTTLVHLVAGLDRPTAGEISWPGLDGSPRDHPGFAGVVFQGDSLAPTLTALENVALPLLLRGASRDEAEESAATALRRLDLGGLANQLPDELSGGQSQRVALARALCCSPKLIIADEPTGRLDHATARRVLDVMLDTADHVGAALVLSTHDPQIAAPLGEHWRMRDGALSVIHGAPATAAPPVDAGGDGQQ